MTKHFLLVICVLCYACNVQAKNDFSECAREMKNPEVSALNCKVLIGLDEKDQKKIIKKTAGLIKNINCQTQVTFKKADFLLKVLKDEVQLDPMPFKCKLSLMDDKTLDTDFNMSPKFNFEKNKLSALDLNIDEFTGIGFLGTLLNKYLSSPFFTEGAIESINKKIESIDFTNMEPEEP